MLLQAPTHISETAANVNARKLIRDAGATDEEMRQFYSEAAHGQGTYLNESLRDIGKGMLIGAPLAAIGHFAHQGLNKFGTLDGKTKYRDLEISIETGRGNYRYWRDPHDGSQGKTKMKYPYGYIRGTKGMDGEHVDCFIGPNQGAANVYVITTNKAPNFTSPDEQKCMLGFNSAQEAKDVFLEHYTDPKFFREMRTFSYADFKDKVLKTKDSASKKVATIEARHAGRNHANYSDLPPSR